LILLPGEIFHDTLIEQADGRQSSEPSGVNRHWIVSRFHLMAEPISCFSSQIDTAAEALTRDETDPASAELLRSFGYDDGDPVAAPARARMLRAVTRFRRLFRLQVPDAPGLVFFGAEADPACLGPHNAGLSVGSFAGSGLDPRQAFEACIGEGIEYLSQFARPDDPLATAPVAAYAPSLDPDSYRFVEAVLAAGDIPADRPISWMPVSRITDGTACWFPADLCLRRAAADFAPPLKLSTGCAAGETPEAARLHGLLELIERDAAALWWRGGRRGRAVSADTEAGQAAAGLLARLRQGQSDRRTLLLDITSDLGVPVVAAFSTLQHGGGFAFGLGARPSLADAAGSAIFEMCQSELSLHVIAAKRRQSGESALNDSDRRQLARAAAVNPDTCPLLQPGDATDATVPLAGNPLTVILQLLAARGIAVYSLDLTRPQFGVPVIRVLAPALQSNPCSIIGDRLARAIAETGGGVKHEGGLALM
jgi:ribosomal protein S12 methylthiotransferase accessory factor